MVGKGGRGLGSSACFGESIVGAEAALARAGAGGGAAGAAAIRVGASIPCSSGTWPSSSHSSIPSRQTSVLKSIVPAKISFSISFSVNSRSCPSG
jgi:hypothetical protein